MYRPYHALLNEGFCTMRRESGVTFLELMVAITIVLIASGAILISLTFAGKIAQHNLNKTVAINLITEKLEEIKSDTYSGVTAENYPLEPNLPVGTNPIGFNRSVTIITGSYKTITVTVTWNQLGSPFVETESISTVITQ